MNRFLMNEININNNTAEININNNTAEINNNMTQILRILI